MMKQLMALERHVNLAETKQGRKNHIKSKRSTIRFKSPTRQHSVANSTAKSEIDDIFENIEKLKASRRATFKKIKPQELPKESPKVSDTVGEIPDNIYESSNNLEDLKSNQWSKIADPPLEPIKSLKYPEKLTSKSIAESLPLANTLKTNLTMVSQVAEPSSSIEKKKQIWEKEREEIQQLRSYNPWGKSGCGAPIKDQYGNVYADYMTRKVNNRVLHCHDAPHHRQHLESGAAAAHVSLQNNVNTNNCKDFNCEHDSGDIHSTIEEQNSFHNETPKKSFLYGRNGPMDDLKKRELEEEKRRDKEYRDYLRSQIEERKRAKQLELERQRKLDAEEEEKARLYFNQLQQQQQQQHREHRHEPVIPSIKPKKGPLTTTEYDLMHKQILEKSRLEAEREKQENKLRKYLEMGHDISKLKAKFEEKFGPLDPGISMNRNNGSRHDPDDDAISFNENGRTTNMSSRFAVNHDSPLNDAFQKNMRIKDSNASITKGSDHMISRIKQNEMPVNLKTSSNNLTSANTKYQRTTRPSLNQSQLDQRQRVAQKQTSKAEHELYSPKMSNVGDGCGFTSHPTAKRNAMEKHETQQPRQQQAFKNDHDVEELCDEDDDEESLDFQDALESEHIIPVAFTTAVLHQKSEHRVEGIDGKGHRNNAPKSQSVENKSRSLSRRSHAEQTDISAPRNPHLESLLAQLKQTLNEKQKKWSKYRDIIA